MKAYIRKSDSEILCEDCMLKIFETYNEYVIIGLYPPEYLICDICLKPIVGEETSKRKEY